MSRRLGTYIVQNAHSGSIQTLIKVQESHYGKVRIRPARMKEYLQAIREQLSDAFVREIKLPSTKAEQLELSQYWTPVC